MDSRKKLDALTSLRFFAAALIVAFHTGTILGIGDISKAIPASQAVSFFFVLSGYILAYAYPDFSKSGTTRKFYIARLARVWPLHIATMLIWVLIIYKMEPATILWEAGIFRLLATIFMVQSWVPIEIWATSINGVSWSISTEIFFYLLFPLIAKNFTHHWKTIIAIALFTIVAISIGSSTLPTQDPYRISANGLIYFFPPVRILEFIAGIGLFHLTRNLKISQNLLTKSQWTLVEISALAFTYLAMMISKSQTIGEMLGHSAGFYISTAGSFPAFAILIGVFSLGMGHVSSLLKTRPLVFLGELSFALYLIHYVVVIYFKQNTDMLSYDWISYCLIWIISLASAWILSQYLEIPSRKIIISIMSDSPTMIKKRKTIAYRCILATMIASLIGYAYYATPKALDYLYPPVAIFTTTPNTNIAKYSNGVSITSFSVFERRDQSLFAKIQFAATNANELSASAAVHLNDKNGNLIYNVGAFSLDSQMRADDNLQVEALVELPPTEYFTTASIGIAVFNDPSALYSVNAPKADWGYTRAIIFAQPNVENIVSPAVSPLPADSSNIEPVKPSGSI